MKNLFNSISQEEKSRILEMHSGKKNVISEQSDPVIKIREFVNSFLPLGAMWVQNKMDNTSYLSPSSKVGVGDRLSFVRKGRNDIKCKLKRDGETIECIAKDGVQNFNLLNDFESFRKWLSNPNH